MELAKFHVITWKADDDLLHRAYVYVGERMIFGARGKTQVEAFTKLPLQALPDDLTEAERLAMAGYDIYLKVLATRLEEGTLEVVSGV